ncbi:MAG: MATE family efflux transporter, partial [Spirochaetaceae bacterium]|nr:MATE family efflux transporter [Spirochaetaceae bacterium]
LNYIAQASSVMATIISLVITALVIFGIGPLLSCYELEEEVRQFAWEYFIIYGGVASFFTAFSQLQSAILRSYGYTKETMYVSMIANVLNVFGNAIALYGLFGLPILGVKGVAASSAFSMVASFVLFSIIIKRKKDVMFDMKGFRNVPKNFYRIILSVGVPTAGESLSYNMSQIVIMAMISTLGTYVMSAQVYTQTIVRFVFIITMAIGNAVQIKAGYYVGAKEYDTAYHKIFKYSAVATSCSVFFILLTNLIKTPIISLFTHQPEVASIVATLLVGSIYIEFGRSLNLIYIGALKGSGDVKFPVVYGIISMWSIIVLFGWFLGIKLGMGILGFWLAIGTEETSRGITMFFRWKSRKWEKSSLV